MGIAANEPTYNPRTLYTGSYKNSQNIKSIDLNTTIFTSRIYKELTDSDIEAQIREDIYR